MAAIKYKNQYSIQYNVFNKQQQNVCLKHSRELSLKM